MKGPLGNIMKQAQKFQAKIAKLQDELGDRTVEASAGGASRLQDGARRPGGAGEFEEGAFGIHLGAGFAEPGGA